MLPQFKTFAGKMSRLDSQSFLNNNQSGFSKTHTFPSLSLGLNSNKRGPFFLGTISFKLNKRWVKLKTSRDAFLSLILGLCRRKAGDIFQAQFVSELSLLLRATAQFNDVLSSRRRVPLFHVSQVQ